MDSRSLCTMKSPNRWPEGALALLVAIGFAGWLSATPAHAQERGPTPVPQANLQEAIGKLGDRAAWQSFLQHLERRREPGQ